MECELPLQTLDGETFSANAKLTGENAHPDIRAKGFYRPGRQNSYFNINFLNPNSESYLSSSTEKIYDRVETQKRRLYNERILNVEHGSFLYARYLCSRDALGRPSAARDDRVSCIQGSFCPLVYSVTGGSAGQKQGLFLDYRGKKYIA